MEKCKNCECYRLDELNNGKTQEVCYAPYMEFYAVPCEKREEKYCKEIRKMLKDSSKQKIPIIRDMIVNGEKMSEKDLKLSVINNADAIAKALTRGRDVEIRKSASGISVAEISKRVVAK